MMLFLLKSSLVLAILTTAYAWLVKRETFLRVNRWLLWLNVAAALLLPVTPLPDWEWLPDAPSEVVANLVSSQPQVVGHQQDVGNGKQSGEGNKTVQIPQTVNHKRQTVNDKPQTVNHKRQTINALTILYFVVVAGLAGRFLVQLVTLWRLRRRGTVYDTDEGLVLVASEAVKTPFSFFKWVFFNPAQHTPDEWAQVYAHERVHALQWHSADMVVAEIFKIVFWFNPFVWWHHRLVQETLEYLTDRAVLDSGIEKKSYQFHLLRSTLQTDTETFTNHFNRSLLKNRIAMMNRQQSSLWALGKYAFFIVALGVALSFIQTNQTSKYFIRQGDEIQWVISPKMTLNDLTQLQETFKKEGIEMQLLEYRMEYLRRFLNRLEVRISDERFVTRNIGNFGIKPILAGVNKVDLKSRRVYLSGWGEQQPFDNSLLQLARQDSILAAKEYLENVMLYHIEDLKNKGEYSAFGDKIQHLSVNQFSKETKNYNTIHLSQSAICKDEVSGEEIIETAKKLSQPTTVYYCDGVVRSLRYISTLSPKNMMGLFTANIYDVEHNFKKPPFTVVLIATNPTMP